ncbi:MAG: PhzF family phenazine biosynthesis isomerase [Ferruginibacter sp.]
MPLKTFIVDAFTDTPFKGNPAGVCIVEEALPETLMQNIAMELGLSETAFVQKHEERNSYSIRFFSPQKEIPLCGHATIASSKVMAAMHGCREIHFVNIDQVDIPVVISGDDITISFPVYSLEAATAPPAMLQALGIGKTKAVMYSRQNNILMLEIQSAKALADLRPDFTALKASHNSINGVLVTAASDKTGYDYEYRYFWPWAGTEEDPVTGGVQTFLAPYWQEKLDTSTMHAFQSSQRTGTMQVELKDNKVYITGRAVMILEGQLLTI